MSNEIQAIQRQVRKLNATQSIEEILHQESRIAKSNATFAMARFGATCRRSASIERWWNHHPALTVGVITGATIFVAGSIVRLFTGSATPEPTPAQTKGGVLRRSGAMIISLATPFLRGAILNDVMKGFDDGYEAPEVGELAIPE